LQKLSPAKLERLVEQSQAPLPQKRRPNWWNRNWKWFVPLGCFSIAVLFVVFVGSVALIVFSAMKSTDVYKDALARAKSNSAVIEALGSPIIEGFLVSGNTNVNGASGEANLSIPISGPNGKGTIYVAANKSLGRWNYSGLIVEIAKTHQRIDLLHSPIPTSSP
jgi:hypothetical protein